MAAPLTTLVAQLVTSRIRQRNGPCVHKVISLLPRDARWGQLPPQAPGCPTRASGASGMHRFCPWTRMAIASTIRVSCKSVLATMGWTHCFSDVQLCEITRRGNWKVVLDFCPGCAADSLAVGGPAKAKPPRGLDSDASSFISGHSKRSSGSISTSVSKMPYVDMDGRPGRYSGRISCQTGLPNGFGRVFYKEGDCFSGLFREGTKVHGKVTNKKAKVSRPAPPSRSTQSTPLPPRGRNSNRVKSRSMDKERKRSKSRYRNNERKNY